MVMLATVRTIRLCDESTIHSHSGNLHLNVVADAYLPEIQDALEPYIYEVVGALFPTCHAGACSHSFQHPIGVQYPLNMELGP